METPINTIHTSCKECAFATYSDNTQDGCSLGYLDVYKQENTEVLEAYDEDKEFYIINNKKCLGYREPRWFESQGLLADSTTSEKIDCYKKSSLLSYVAIIDLKEVDLPMLSKIVCDLADSKIPAPSKIILIRHLDSNKKDLFFDHITDIFKKSGLSCPWRIQSVMDEAVDIIPSVISINKQYRFLFFIAQSSDPIIPIVQKAYEIIYDKLDRFMIISDTEKTCMMYSTILYSYCRYFEIPFLEEEKNYIIV